MPLARIASLLFLATAAPALAEAPDSRAPRVALWVQPVFSIAFGATGGGLYLSGGAQVAVNDWMDLALTLSGLRLGSTVSQESAITADLALVFRPFARRRLSGFFVALKAGGGGGWSQLYGGARRSGEAHIGLDLGWQFVWGPVFFAPVVGVAYFPYLSGSENMPFAAGIVPVGDPRFGINLNILRVGFAF